MREIPSLRPYAQETIEYFQKEKPPTRQLPVLETPSLHKEVLIQGDRQKSLGYVTKVEPHSRAPGVYYVWTSDGGDYRFEVVVESAGK